MTCTPAAKSEHQIDKVLPMDGKVNAILTAGTVGEEIGVVEDLALVVGFAGLR